MAFLQQSDLCAFFSEGKIQYAFSCLNDLYNKCAKSREGTQQFDLLVDVGRWQQAMENICDNIHCEFFMRVTTSITLTFPLSQ